MKKMTAKEFKEILTDAGMDFSIWGYEGIINVLSLYYRHESQRYMDEYLETHDRGAKACMTIEYEKADRMYKALEERGYYNR